MFLLPQISRVAILQNSEFEVVVKSFCVLDLMYIVEVDSKGIFIVQVTNVNLNPTGHLFAIPDEFGSMSIVSACMLLCSSTDIVLIA